MIAIQQSNTDKLVAAAVTSVLLIGAMLVLQRTDIPAVKQKTEVYEEINWTRLKPKPETITEQPKPEQVQPDKPKIAETQPEPAPAPKAQKVDLSSLENLNVADLSKPTQTLQRNTPEQTKASQSRSAKIDLKSSNLTAGLNSALGESSQKLNLSRSGRRGRTVSQSSGLKAKSGQKVDLSGESNLGGGGLTLGAPEARDAAGSTPQVSMMAFSDLGSDFSDLSPIYHALLDWMKRNPADFPSVVGRFMEESAGDLTSIASFQIDGRQFELFLLCKQNLHEVRICLLEGDQSTYLIDRGMKENSSYLRVGSVNRTPTDRILSFGTVRTAASDARTQEFYQIFFSWWESVQ